MKTTRTTTNGETDETKDREAFLIAAGIDSGKVLIAASRGTPRTPAELVGPILGARGPVFANFNGGGGNGIHYNTQELRNPNQGLPFRISYRMY